MRQQWSESSLDPVMACCLTAPSHYLNQCWPINHGLLQHPVVSSFMVCAYDLHLQSEFENDTYHIPNTSPVYQWVNGYLIETLPVTNCPLFLTTWTLTQDYDGPQWVNSLWPSDPAWQQRSGSSKAQIMACCLMAPSHYRNQYRLISKVQ